MIFRSGKLTVALIFSLAGIIAADKPTLDNPVEFQLSYNVDKDGFSYFSLKSSLTYTESSQQTMPANFVPEFNLDYSLTFDKTLVPQKTGILCLGADENNCIPGADEITDADPYLGTKFNYF